MKTKKQKRALEKVISHGGWWITTYSSMKIFGTPNHHWDANVWGDYATGRTEKEALRQAMEGGHG